MQSWRPSEGEWCRSSLAAVINGNVDMTCCKYNAGMLRHKIAIEQEQRTPDAYGGVSVVWQVFKSVRSSITPLSGKTRWNSDQTEPEVTHKIILRYVQGVDASMRVTYQGRILYIKSVINIDERSKWLELRCEERDGDQNV